MAQSTIVGQEKISVKESRTESEPPTSTAAKAQGARKRKGLSLERRYTQAGTEADASIVWERRQSVITNPDGSIVFKMDGAEIPSGWSQLATDIVVSKYFRKAGLHGDKSQGETSVRKLRVRPLRGGRQLR